MSERKIHIDFQKIIDESYYCEDLLLIYQWIIKLGRTCSEQIGWNRYGLHQSFHGYSYNNEAAQVYPLDKDWNKTIYGGFVRILCRSKYPSVVACFLSENRIQIGKKRVIKVIKDELKIKYDTLRNPSLTNILYYITTAYKGLELKKELFQPDYTKRIHPRIIDHVKFGTNGDKWYAWFTYSFECMDYEPGWEYTISQNANEDICSFFNRAAMTIDELLLIADSCDNCPLWVESEHHGSYLRHGYKGCCRMCDICEKNGVVKYHWWSDDSGVHDNAIHHSIVFPYYKTR